MSNQAEYRQLCASEPAIPLFSTDWWLDAVAGSEGWQVALARIKGAIVGAMPYVLSRRYGMRVIGQPVLTPQLGPWLPDGKRRAVRSLTHEQKVMQLLIEQLPPFDHFAQTWPAGRNNWLPFYWHGYAQTTEYTYVLPELGDLDAVWNGLDSARRRHCKQAREQYHLKLRDDLPVDAFIELHRQSLARRGATVQHSDDDIRRLDAACAARNCRRILVVVDQAGRHCAATYGVWDGDCFYALMKGADPAMHHTGGPSLCQWESIKFAATVARRYDFLGNMNATIEPYVRSFGTLQTPLFSISKTPSRLLRLRRGLLSALAR